MFHTSDLYAVWSPKRLDREGLQKKALSIRDFYNFEDRRLGYIQSLGLDAGVGHVAMFMKDTIRKFGVRNELLLKLMVKLPAKIVAQVLGNASIFAGMSEDDPDPENRVVLDPTEPNGASFTYVITDDLKQRADDLYENFKRRVKPWRVARLSPRLELNYGHPCGTCRFGIDSSTSVLNADCRAHDLTNLYVVDASFMPRSGAVNPSLTIAANAIRVADRIALSFCESEIIT
jgi:hypothetical protein